jgi:hypothetical protein
VVVLGSSELKPVKWREWANRQESENPGYIVPTPDLALMLPRASNILEHRPGFLDIRAKRKEFSARKNIEDKK